MGCPRWVPHRPFPAYAYLPGRYPHPVRDPEGHSYQVPPVPVDARIESEEFLWGEDLFNHGYYWEAHEAWEGMWHSADKGSEIRALLKGLILLSATGVKVREGKRTAAMRHAGRAAVLFQQLANGQHHHFERALGIRLDVLAKDAEAAAAARPVSLGASKGGPEPVFKFILGGELTLPTA